MRSGNHKVFTFKRDVLKINRGNNNKMEEGKRMKNKEENNITLKRKIRESGVKQWQIAEHLGIWESSFSKLFRHPIPEDIAKEIEEAIEILTSKRDE